MKSNRKRPSKHARRATRGSRYPSHWSRGRSGTRSLAAGGAR